MSDMKQPADHGNKPKPNPAQPRQGQHHQRRVPLEEQVAIWFDRNWRGVLGLAAAVAIGGVGYAGYQKLQSGKEKKAQEELFVVTMAVQKKTEKLQEELQGQASKTPTKLVKNPEELKKQYAAELENLQKVLDRHSGTKAEIMAAVQLAGLARDYHDFSLAKSTLEKVVTKVKVGSVDLGLVRGLYGSVLADTEDCKGAISEFDKILADKSQETFRSQALLRKGSCHVTLGEWDQADAAFAEIEKDFANSSAAFTAKNLRRLVSVKKGS